MVAPRSMASNPKPSAWCPRSIPRRNDSWLLWDETSCCEATVAGISKSRSGSLGPGCSGGASASTSGAAAFGAAPSGAAPSGAAPSGAAPSGAALAGAASNSSVRTSPDAATRWSNRSVRLLKSLRSMFPPPGSRELFGRKRLDVGEHVDHVVHRPATVVVRRHQHAARVSEADVVRELERAFDDAAQVLGRLRRGVEVDPAAVAAMAVGAGLVGVGAGEPFLVEYLPCRGVPRDRLAGREIDAPGEVHHPLLDELDDVPDVLIGERLIHAEGGHPLRLRAALYEAEDLFRRVAMRHEESLHAGEVRARRVGSIDTPVVPAVALVTAPGGSDALGCPFGQRVTRVHRGGRDALFFHPVVEQAPTARQVRTLVGRCVGGVGLAATRRQHQSQHCCRSANKSIIHVNFPPLERHDDAVRPSMIFEIPPGIPVPRTLRLNASPSRRIDLSLLSRTFYPGCQAQIG